MAHLVAGVLLVDFMKDTALLKKVKIVSVDRIGFGYSEFGDGEKSLEEQAEYLLPIVQQYKKSGKKLILDWAFFRRPADCKDGNGLSSIN